MKKFEVELKEILSKVVIVEANNESEAYEKIREDYYGTSIILDSDCCTESTIEVLGEKEY